MSKTTCSSCFTKTKETVLSCDTCEKWFCVKCHKLPSTFVDQLTKYENLGATWNCLLCKTNNNSSKKLVNKVDSMLEKVNSIAEQLNTDNQLKQQRTFADIVSRASDIVEQLPTSTDTTDLIQSTIDNTITKQNKISDDNNRRELNHIIHGIQDDVDIEPYLESLFKTTLHCRIPKRYTRLGKANSDFSVSRRILRITYSSLAEKNTVNENLRLLKDSTHSKLRFTSDYNPTQLAEISAMKAKAKSQNESNTDSNTYYVVRGSPSKNLHIMTKTKSI